MGSQQERPEKVRKGPTKTRRVRARVRFERLHILFAVRACALVSIGTLSPSVTAHLCNARNLNNNNSGFQPGAEAGYPHDDH